jgi:methionine biosynthesis protein MetW
MPIKILSRFDLEVIANLVAPNASVLDIGCGDGELLQYLKAHKNIDGRGIEILQDQVGKALARGLSVVQGDAETDLGFYPDQSFDYAILSHVIQVTIHPDKILQEILRIAKYAIVALPNFAHIRNRTHLMFKGTMPVNEAIPYEWYETPNIHFCSIKEFTILCQKLELTIAKEIYINKKFLFPNIVNNKFFANIFADYAIFVLVKNDLAPISEAVLVDSKTNVFAQKITPQFA